MLANSSPRFANCSAFSLPRLPSGMVYSTLLFVLARVSSKSKTDIPFLTLLGSLAFFIALSRVMSFEAIVVVVLLFPTLPITVSVPLFNSLSAFSISLLILVASASINSVNADLPLIQLYLLPRLSILKFLSSLLTIDSAAIFKYAAFSIVLPKTLSVIF